MPSCRSASSRSRSAADAIAICQCMPWRPSRWRTQPAAAWRMDGATATTGSGNSLAFRARLLLLLQSGRRRARCRQAGRGRVNEIALTAHADGCDLLGWEGNRMAFCGDYLFLAFGMCCATNLLLLFSCPVPQISFPPCASVISTTCRGRHAMPCTALCCPGRRLCQCLGLLLKAGRQAGQGLMRAARAANATAKRRSLPFCLLSHSGTVPLTRP